MAKQLETLQAELDALDADTQGDDAYERIEALQDKIEAIEQGLQQPDPRAVKIAGILLTIEHDGRVEITRGLIRAEDKKALKALAKSPDAGMAAGGDRPRRQARATRGGSIRGAASESLRAVHRRFAGTAGCLAERGPSGAGGDAVGWRERQLSCAGEFPVTCAARPRICGPMRRTSRPVLRMRP